MRIFFCFTLLFLLSNSAYSGTTPYEVMGKWYYPIKSVQNFKERGVASWYGKKFHGRKTANGEIYNMHAMTAAHKTLPLGVFVEVVNLTNSKKCIVRVNDRGPFVNSRIIDLSYKAAKILEVDGPGTAKVFIRVISKKKYYSPKNYKRVYQNVYYTIQIASYKDVDKAEKMKEVLDKTFKFARVKRTSDGVDTFHRVRVGRCKTLKTAMEYEKAVVQLGYPDAFAVSE